MQISNRALFIVSGLMLVLGVGLTAARSGREGIGAMGSAAGAGMPGGHGLTAVETRGTGAGEAAKTEIKWMNVAEAAGKLQQEQRPVLIDLYTTWCGWCRQMDRKTYSNKHVAEYVESKFYPVKLDAESHEVLSWKGRSFGFNAGTKVNDFAMYLTRGQLEFPTTVIIPPGGDPQAIPGYLEPRELETLLKYFGEGKYKTESFDVWHQNFKGSW